MPHIETLEQAKHFILGPKAYAGAPSPWTAPITSFQRPDCQSRQSAPIKNTQTDESAQA
jgi:hydroxymethylglutaryl-CoA lyase